MNTVTEKFKYNALSMAPETLELVVVSGSWYEMGRQYVQQCKEAYHIRAAEMFSDYLGIFKSPDKVKNIIQNYLIAAKEETPQIIDILQGMADESGLDIEMGAILLYGMSMIRIELEKQTKEQCSTTGAWGKATKDGRFICAANVDMEVNTTNYLPAMLCYPDDGIPYICGENFHRNGINEKGVVMLLSGGNNAGPGGAIAGDDRHMWNDANIMAFSSCNTAEEARELYAKYKYVVGCNQFIGDKSRDAMVIEFTGSKFVVRRAGDYGETDYLVTANLYVAKELQDNIAKGPMYWDLCLPRYWTYYKIYNENLGKLTLDDLAQAHSSYDYYVPEGWSFNPQFEDGIWWHNDDSCPYPSGWHRHDPDINHGPWSPQMRGPVGAAARFAVDVDNLTFYGMRGETSPLFSNTPNSCGAFWSVTLGGTKEDVVMRAKMECDNQIAKASYALYELKDEDAEKRLPYLMKARQKLFEGVNNFSLARCAGGYTTEEEKNFYLGKALSAFCAGQAFAKKSQSMLL